MFQVNKVLIVDDNDIDILIQEKTISKADVTKEVKAFNTATAAISFLEEIPHTDFLPEIIFLDLNMPKMNGFDFVIQFENIKHPFKDKTNIVVLSNSLDQYQTDLLLGNKYIRGCYPKPLDEHVIEEIFEQLHAKNNKATHPKLRE